MKSPFPGMDPYLEQCWGDVRASFVVYSSDKLNCELPGDLVARINDQLFLDSTMQDSCSPRTHDRFIEIREVKSDKLITVIVFIEPTEWLFDERQPLYREKVRDLQMAGVNFVEVDIVRAGPKRLNLPHDGSSRPPAPYHIVVRRGSDWGYPEIKPVSLRERLPTIHIPLRSSDTDATLDLQVILDMAYSHGRYDITDYQQDPDPPLEGHDAEWADALLRAAGRRK